MCMFECPVTIIICINIEFTYYIKQKPLLKGVNFKSNGSKFFPYTIDPFSEEDKNNFDSYLSLYMYLFP